MPCAIWPLTGFWERASASEPSMLIARQSTKQRAPPTNAHERARTSWAARISEVQIRTRRQPAAGWSFTSFVLRCAGRLGRSSEAAEAGSALGAGVMSRYPGDGCQGLVLIAGRRAGRFGLRRALRRAWRGRWSRFDPLRWDCGRNHGQGCPGLIQARAAQMPARARSEVVTEDSSRWLGEATRNEQTCRGSRAILTLLTIYGTIQ